MEMLSPRNTPPYSTLRSPAKSTGFLSPSTCYTLSPPLYLTDQLHTPVLDTRILYPLDTPSSIYLLSTPPTPSYPCSPNIPYC